MIKAIRLDPALVVIGAVTPPFVCNLFMAIMIFRRPFVEVVWGVPPFLVIFLEVTGLLVAFPQIALFLPDLAYRKIRRNTCQQMVMIADA